MKKILAFLISLSVVAIAVGCNNTDNTALRTPQNVDGMFVSDVAKRRESNGEPYFPSRSFNIHGQMETTYGGVPTTSFNNIYDVRRAKQVTRAVRNINGVEDARVVMMQEGIIVYVLPTSQAEKEQIEQQVYRVVKQMVGNKEIQIISQVG